MTAGFNKVASLLDNLPGMEKSSLVEEPDWRDSGFLNHYPQPPAPDFRPPEFRWPKTDPMPGPSPQPGPGGQGGKWECKYVNEPSKPKWGGGIFDTLPRPTPGNI